MPLGTGVCSGYAEDTHSGIAGPKARISAHRGEFRGGSKSERGYWNGRTGIEIEIEIERKEGTKREVQATGIANAMQIIRGRLNSLYIQHEAIEALKLIATSAVWRYRSCRYSSLQRCRHQSRRCALPASIR